VSTSFLYKPYTIYYEYCKDKFYNDLHDKSCTELVQNQIRQRETRSLPKLTSKLGTVHKRTIPTLYII